MSTESIIVLLLSIPLSILASLLVPPIQDYLANIYFPIRRKRIKAILNEYQRIARIQKDNNRFLGTLFRELAFQVLSLSALILTVFIFIINPSLSKPPLEWQDKIISLVLIIGMIYAANFVLFKPFSIIKYVQRVNDLDSYRNEVHLRVEKLGGEITNLTETGYSFTVKEDLENKRPYDKIYFVIINIIRSVILLS